MVSLLNYKLVSEELQQAQRRDSLGEFSENIPNSDHGNLVAQQNSHRVDRQTVQSRESDSSSDNVCPVVVGGNSTLVIHVSQDDNLANGSEATNGDKKTESVGIQVSNCTRDTQHHQKSFSQSTTNDGQPKCSADQDSKSPMKQSHFLNYRGHKGGQNKPSECKIFNPCDDFAAVQMAEVSGRPRLPSGDLETTLTLADNVGLFDNNFTVTWRNLKFSIEPKWNERLARKSSRLVSLAQQMMGTQKSQPSADVAHEGKAGSAGAQSSDVLHIRVPEQQKGDDKEHSSLAEVVQQPASSRVVLDHLDGSFRSGEITAILGPSGAGKTTLLDCLTGHRKSGLSGSIRFSSASSKAPGRVVDEQFSHCCEKTTTIKQANKSACCCNVEESRVTRKNGYQFEASAKDSLPTISTNEDNLKVSIIPQKDHLIGHLTVYETLNYASKMKNCFDKTFDHRLNIKRVAEQLGLMSCLRTRINKLSGGQYKRVSIAQELLSSPDILILDEPTSGLDAMTCYQTVQVLRKLTDERSSLASCCSSSAPQTKPIAVILTIHQPNSDVFQQFDHVYVVAQGGKCIYEGPPSSIESVINRIGLELPNTYYNPATMIVEIAAGKFGQESILKLNSIQRTQYAQQFALAPDEQNSTSDSAVDCPSSSCSFASSSSHNSDEEGNNTDRRINNHRNDKSDYNKGISGAEISRIDLERNNSRLVSSGKFNDSKIMIGNSCNGSSQIIVRKTLEDESRYACEGGLINKGFIAEDELTNTNGPYGGESAKQQLGHIGAAKKQAEYNDSNSNNNNNNNNNNNDFNSNDLDHNRIERDTSCHIKKHEGAVSMAPIVLNQSAANDDDCNRNGRRDHQKDLVGQLQCNEGEAEVSVTVSDKIVSTTLACCTKLACPSKLEGCNCALDYGQTGKENLDNRARKKRRRPRRRAASSSGARLSLCNASAFKFSSDRPTGPMDLSSDITKVPLACVAGRGEGGGGGGGGNGHGGGKRPEKRLKLNSLKADQRFPFWRHTYLHFHRSWLSIVRDPMLCSMQLALHIVVPLMVSLVYGTHVGKPNACPRAGPIDIMAYALEPNDTALQLQEDLRTTLENIGYIFFKLYGIIFAAMTVTVLTFPLDMHVLVKEFRNGWYGLSSYFIGRTLADIPFQLTLPLLAMSLSYYTTGQPSSHMQWRFFSITAILILSSLIAQSQGLLFGAILMDRMKAAVFVAPAATTPIILFAGFLVRTQSIPRYLRPLSNLSYLRYAIEACLISRYGFNQCECDPALFNQTVPELPPIARSMLDYWLSSFKAPGPSQAESDTLSAATNSSAAQLEITTMAAGETKPDLFTKLIDSLARANSFGRNITSCEQVVPYPMIDYDLQDSQLLHCFAILLAMLIFTRLLTFFIVCFKVKRKV